MQKPKLSPTSCYFPSTLLITLHLHYVGKDLSMAGLFHHVSVQSLTCSMMLALAISQEMPLRHFGSTFLKL